MEYIYRLNDKNIVLKVPFEIVIQEQNREFIYLDKYKDYVYSVEFIEVDHIEDSSNGIKMNERKYDGNHIYFYEGNELYACMIWEKPYRCLYTKHRVSWVKYSTKIIDILGLENVLLHMHSILLHSSYIMYKDQGIVFTAPSGTGKSTQASLWNKYKDAKIINGDRSGITKEDNHWYVYGVPLAGSSDIYLNEKYPLQAIVVLRQSKDDHIRRLSGKEAYMYLFSEVIVHLFDALFTMNISSIIEELVKDIPIYLLECTKEKSAVDLLGGILDD